MLSFKSVGFKIVTAAIVIDLCQHKNEYDSAIFTKIEINFIWLLLRVIIDMYFEHQQATQEQCLKL